MNERSSLLIRGSIQSEREIELQREETEDTGGFCLPKATCGEHDQNTRIEEYMEQVGDIVEEMVHDMTTFEPADPDELMREVIEHAIELTSDELAEHGTENETSNGDVGRPGNDLTYPEQQMIESHYTSSPEKLGVVSMAVLIFYNVSGGPFGVETTVRAGGNFYALLGFLIMPFVWSLQEALMTTELATTFPEASGGVAWVEEAFGHGVGWMQGYLSWISGATDNAIYPVLFLDYLLQIVGHTSDDGTESELMTPTVRFCLLSSTTIMLAYVNWRGLDLVGKMSIFICILSLSPFVVLIIVGSFKVDPSRWLELPNAGGAHNSTVLEDDDAVDTHGGFFPNASWGGILWRPFLNNLFWNLNSFDSGGNMVAELDSTTPFIRAMMLGLLMSVSFYFFPLLIAIGASDSQQEDWTDGYLAVVNTEVVGPWLGAWTIFAAGISNIALFQAELTADAFQLMGMGDRGYLPKIFSKRSRHGTPTYGLVVGTIVIVVMGVSDLERLIEMLNFNYAIGLLLEYAAFFKLRVSRPNIERPYRIPLNTIGCAVFFFPAIAGTLLVIALADFTTYYFALGSFVTGCLVYAAKQRYEKSALLLSDADAGDRSDGYAHVAGGGSTDDDDDDDNDDDNGDDNDDVEEEDSEEVDSELETEIIRGEFS